MGARTPPGVSERTWRDVFFDLDQYLVWHWRRLSSKQGQTCTWYWETTRVCRCFPVDSSSVATPPRQPPSSHLPPQLLLITAISDRSLFKHTQPSSSLSHNMERGESAVSLPALLGPASPPDDLLFTSVCSPSSPASPLLVVSWPVCPQVVLPSVLEVNPPVGAPGCHSLEVLPQH